MENDLRISILQEIYPDSLLKEGKCEIVAWCDFGCAGRHHRRKLQINYEKNIFNCWVCSESGYITKLLNKKATKNQRKKYLATIKDFHHHDDSPKQFSLELPPYHSFLFEALHDTKAMRSLEWLISKCNIDEETIFQQKIGYCHKGDYGGRLIFPSFSDSGNMNFYVSRDIDRSDTYKYLNCSGVSTRDIIFNEILIDWNRPIFLFEGIKAYLKHISISNVVPMMGSRFNENYAIFKKSILEDVPKIYVGLDHEAKEKSYEIMNLYDYYGIETFFLDLEDVNQSDELETEELLERIEMSKPFSKKDLLDMEIERIRRSI